MLGVKNLAQCMSMERLTYILKKQIKGLFMRKSGSNLFKKGDIGEFYISKMRDRIPKRQFMHIIALLEVPLICTYDTVII